jgi:hypothetical protein
MSTTPKKEKGRTNSNPLFFPGLYATPRCCNILIMANDEFATILRDLPKNQSVLKRMIGWLLRIFVLMVAGIIAYFWSGLSILVLIRFDRTSLEPGEDPTFGLPIDYTATLLWCLGPAGWLVVLGVFGFAFIMALAVYRWPWVLRAIVAAAPPVLVLRQTIYVSDLNPWVRPVCLQIESAEVLLALLAAVLCRPIARRLQSAKKGAFVIFVA